MPELDFREGEPQSIAQSIRASGAYKFAESYNRMVFQKREGDVKRFCPQASLRGT